MVQSTTISNSGPRISCSAQISLGTLPVRRGLPLKEKNHPAIWSPMVPGTASWAAACRAIVGPSLGSPAVSSFAGHWSYVRRPRRDERSNQKAAGHANANYNRRLRLSRSVWVSTWESCSIRYHCRQLSRSRNRMRQSNGAVSTTTMESDNQNLLWINE